jgi:feruloyl-CoA synthase
VLSHQGHGSGGRRHLIAVERERDGTLLLRGEPLREHAPSLLALLDDAARRAPDRPFLIERDAREVWHQATFATVAARSHRVGAALLALGASAQRPVMILSGNGIDHAQVMFGALRAGVPVVPVSARTGLAARDGFARLRSIAHAVRPGVVFARDGAAYAAGVQAAAPEAAFVTVSEPPRGVRALDYARLLAHAPLPDGAVAVGADTIAKVLFTWRSSVEPAGVVTTHGMICAMLQGIAQAWPFLDDHPPVVVDWLPWSHCFGGNEVLGIVLRHAGTLYVDDGNPSGERFERSARLRAEIPPTLAFDVPLGWTAWVARLRADDALRRRWLSRLDLACWEGATLAPATRDALRALDVPLAAGWGSTETSPAIALTSGVDPKYDAIGAPVAGVELKLVPSGDAYEARVRAPQVTPGYWWRPDLTAEAFDADGFFRTGDVVRPVDARAPQRGLEFVSRLDERFKLSSGTWVRGGALRERFLGECSDVADAVVTGDGRAEIGLLVWPTADGLQLDRDLLRAQIAAAMRRCARGDGSSSAPRRALLLAESPAPAERTDTGALVRRAVLARRAASVARLHASEPDADVILAG